MEHSQANQGWPVTFQRHKRVWRECFVRATRKSPTADSVYIKYLDSDETARCVPKLRLIFNEFMHECLTFEFPKQLVQQRQSTDLNPNSDVLQIFPVCLHVVLKVSPIYEIDNMHCQESPSLMYKHWQISKIYSHTNVCRNLTISCVSLSCWHDNNTDGTFVVWSLQCYRRQARSLPSHLQILQPFAHHPSWEYFQVRSTIWEKLVVAK